jgi:hypothetical protein
MPTGQHGEFDETTPEKILPNRLALGPRQC